MEKREQLLKELQAFAQQNVCLAYSGGVDSALLLYLLLEQTKKTGKQVYAVTFDTKLHPKADAKIAKRTAEAAGADFYLLQIEELENEELLNNPKNRCYLCKKELFTGLKKFAEEKGCAFVLEGTNADDLTQYRPGIRAVKELGIQSPLAAAKMTKAEIRSWASELGIPVADRPSTPCMATRIPYGERLVPSTLARLADAETALKKLGFAQNRCRLHGQVLRIEVENSELGAAVNQREAIVAICKKLGFCYVTLDLEGFRSGSMDIDRN